MARPSDFVDHDYDQRLAEFKARRARMKKEMGEEDKQPEPRKKSY